MEQGNRGDGPAGRARSRVAADRQPPRPHSRPRRRVGGERRARDREISAGQLRPHRARPAGGIRVLKATGLETEARLAFAGLHQLLHPVLGGLDELPGPQRDALRAAFGMTDVSAPDLFLTALAALDLLADSARADHAAGDRRGCSVARPLDRRRSGVRRTTPGRRADRAASGDPRRLRQPSRAGRTPGAEPRTARSRGR